MNHGIHQPVLLRQAVTALNVQPEGCYVDATFGRGGHTKLILAQLSQSGRLWVFDKDPQAVAVAEHLAAEDDRLQVRHDSFCCLRKLAESQGLEGRLNGVLIDLGVSSPQFDDPERGFSFRNAGPLDMRMNPQVGISAAQWLQTASEQEISQVLWRYGEERQHRRLARAIVQDRELRPFRRTDELAALIERVIGRTERDKHPATRAFQAIRIYINRELDELEQVLGQALDVLAVGGRLVVISFHSLEDRIVKRFMRNASRIDPGLVKLPVLPANAHPRARWVIQQLRPDEAEVQQNPRARSAVLRAIEKVV